jgi:peptidylprolyl isomerase
MRRATVVAWLLFFAGVGLVAWYYFATVPGSQPQVVTEAPGEAGGPQIEITVAGQANGKILIELYENLAPQHVERITRLAEEGAYDGVVFHRVIDGFMAQTGDVAFGLEGGDMRQAGMGGSDYPDLPAEFSEEPFVRGTVGMARSQDPDSGNSQFFIMFDEASFLDGDYTVVGRVIEGMDVVLDIKRGEGPNGAIIGQPDVMTNVEVMK